MRALLASALAAVLAFVSLIQTVDALSAPSAVAVAALDDPADAIPSVEEIRAALTILGAPTINEHDIPDDDPLWDLFDEGGRYVAVPTTSSDEVTFVVGAYNVEDGVDERADFQATYGLVGEYAAKRGGTSDLKPVAVADAMGANEAYMGHVLTQSGGKTHLMFVRLSRFGNTVTWVSSETAVKTNPTDEGDIMGLAIINEVVAQLVANKAK